MQEQKFVPRFWRKAVRDEARLRWQSLDPRDSSRLEEIATFISTKPRPEYRYYHPGKDQSRLQAEVITVLETAEELGRLADSTREIAQTLYLDGMSLEIAIETGGMLDGD